MTISEKAFGQFMKIMKSGTTNMFDRGTVQDIAHAAGYVELVSWIEANKIDYGQIVFGDVEVIPDDA